MSNVILSANSSSALLASLNESESKVNPNIYNLPMCYPNSSTQWYNVEPNSGTAANGQSHTFQLAKYGILEQLIFSYEKTIVATRASTGTISIPIGDMITQVISRVEFMSSSKILSTLYSQDIIAMLSDLDSDYLYGPSATALKGSDPSESGSGAATVSATFTLPLVFDFMTNGGATNFNLAFQEPCSVRIVYNNLDGVTATQGAGELTNVKGSLDKVNLMIRYKTYDEQDTAEMLASNYEAESLNMLISRRFRENPQSFTSSGGDHTFKIELRNVDVIENYYFIVQENYAVTSGKQTSSNDCVEIKNIKLSASGQEICNLTTDQLIYMKLTDQGWPMTNSNTGSSTTLIKLGNVGKVQTGIMTKNHAWTNGFSQREMISCFAEVTCSLTSGKSYTCYVQEKTSAIVSVSSNVGRTQLSLVN